MIFMHFRYKCKAQNRTHSDVFRFYEMSLCCHLFHDVPHRLALFIQKTGVSEFKDMAMHIGKIQLVA